MKTINYMTAKVNTKAKETLSSALNLRHSAFMVIKYSLHVDYKLK